MHLDRGQYAGLKRKISCKILSNWVEGPGYWPIKMHYGICAKGQLSKRTVVLFCQHITV